MTSRLFVGSGAVAALAFAASPFLSTAANAQTDLRMIWTVEGQDGNPSTTDYNWGDINGNPGGLGTLNPLGDYQVDGNADSWHGYNYNGNIAGLFQSGESWSMSWDCIFNDDIDTVAAGGGAFVTANIVVTNNDVSTQTFTLLMSLPVAPVVNPVERGSIVGTVTDLSLDSATVSAVGAGQIYTPRIDGADESPGFLMGGGFSETAGFLDSATVGPADFGIPAPIAATQDVDSTIAIFLEFDLTAGDSASFTAIYEVLVPGPGGLSVLAAFGLLAGRRRRRRR